jgi:hypothetical protein
MQQRVQHTTCLHNRQKQNEENIFIVFHGYINDKEQAQ